MNYQELLEDGGILPQTGFRIWSRAVCFYRRGDEMAAELCRQTQKRWNQFTRYHVIREEELGLRIRDAMAQMELDMPYGGIGTRRRIFIVYITSSSASLDVQECMEEYSGILRLDIVRIAGRRNMPWRELPRAKGARFQWFLDYCQYGSHYVLVLLLLSEIYNDKGVYLFLERMTQGPIKMDAFSITVSVYNKQAQERARAAKAALGHALGFSMRGRESIAMVEESFMERFRCQERTAAQICACCPGICDLMVSYDGYEALRQKLGKMKAGEKLFFSDVMKYLYGTGEGMLDGPAQLMKEAERILDKACYEWMEKNCKSQMYGYPYRFFIQESARIAEREQDKESGKYQKQLAFFEEMIRKEPVSFYGSGVSAIQAVCEQMDLEFGRCLHARVYVKWWDVLNRFIQDRLMKDQQVHLELQECYYFLEDYIVENREEDKNSLAGSDLHDIDWSKPPKDYFEAVEIKQTGECNEEDLYRFRERMNWRTQGGGSQERGRRTFYFYGADKSLEEGTKRRYGNEGELSDVVFLEGAGRMQLYLLRIQAWEEETRL